MTANLNHPTFSDTGLATRSVQILRDGQHESGAFIACPNFPSYRFAWLRDGSFCARALDTIGDHDRAARFHRWVERTVLTHGDRARHVIESLAEGRTPPADQMLPARYDLDGRLERPGQVEPAPWPNFQLDGYGIWLNELEAHLASTGATEFDERAVDLVARYLAASWRLDCYDCWEEFGDGQHASTLASVAAGLAAAGRLLGSRKIAREADLVRAALLSDFLREGYLRKGRTDDRVDASLLWAALPLGVLEVDDPAMVKTADEVRRALSSPAGGVYRYIGDSYYGGGEWILLACWLAWYDARTGNRESSERIGLWVLSQAGADGELPEQVTNTAQDPTMVDPWVRRWGPVATPLLWSHAMYLIASEASQ